MTPEQVFRFGELDVAQERLRQQSVGAIIRGMETQTNIDVLEARGELTRAEADQIRELLPVLRGRARAEAEEFIAAQVAGQPTKIRARDLLRVIAKAAGTRATVEAVKARMAQQEKELLLKQRRLRASELKSENDRLKIAGDAETQLLEDSNAYAASQWAEDFNANSVRPYVWVKTGKWRHEKFDLGTLGIRGLTARRFYAAAIKRGLSVEEYLRELGFPVD